MKMLGRPYKANGNTSTAKAFRKSLENAATAFEDLRELGVDMRRLAVPPVICTITPKGLNTAGRGFLGHRGVAASVRYLKDPKIFDELAQAMTDHLEKKNLTWTSSDRTVIKKARAGDREGALKVLSPHYRKGTLPKELEDATVNFFTKGRMMKRKTECRGEPKSMGVVEPPDPRRKIRSELFDENGDFVLEPYPENPLEWSEDEDLIEEEEEDSDDVED
jgi:hypothetical protein